MQGGDILKAHVRTEEQANVHLPFKAMGRGRVNDDLHDDDLDQISEHLPKPAQTAGKGLSPRDFPSMRITCRDCRKGDFPIEQLTLSLTKVRDGR